MLPYKNVYSLENGRLVKNTENKIEYNDKNGKKRVKTNPTYEDFAKIGKFRLKMDEILENAEVLYIVEDGFIVPKKKEVEQ